MALTSCRQADLNDKVDGENVLFLLNSYATDIMGGNEPLSEFVQSNLISELAKRSIAKVFLAFVGSEPAGLAICFEGFSTFACQPLLNIHDFAVHPTFRRRGVGTELLFFIEQQARQMGYCKITLEVLEGNMQAKALYRQLGFEGYELDPDSGHALFWQKKLL